MFGRDFEPPGHRTKDPWTTGQRALALIVIVGFLVLLPAFAVLADHFHWF